MNSTPPLAATRFGQPRIHLRITDSTNRVARELASRGAPHGTLVTTEEQTAGRGRQGRAWSAPRGVTLLASWIVRPPNPLLSLSAGVAVAETCGPAARIKWPNDVLIRQRKVAGILVEARPQEGWAVLGVGLNVALGLHQLPADLRERAGTLGLARADIEPTLARLTSSLQRWLEAPVATVLEAVRERDALNGQPVSWEGGTGRASGIDDQGRLLVELSDGSRQKLDAGEVHLV